MQNSSYRDPFDPAPKWVRRKPISPEVSEDNWGHIPGTANKVTNLTLPDSPASSTPKTLNIEISAITANETFIADRILNFPDKEKLILACSDPSGEQYLALSAPIIDRLRNIIEGELINPDHVLFLLRKKLKITIS